MTTAYADCLRVEASSMLELASWLEMQADEGRFVVLGTQASPLEDELQLTYGDAFATVRGRLQVFEFKTEVAASSNFFLETWSDRRVGMNRMGWLYTSRADWLCYYFRTPTNPTLYVLPFRPLRDWLLAGTARYRHVEQRKREQRYETWGLLVPIADVRNAMRVAVWHAKGGSWEEQ